MRAELGNRWAKIARALPGRSDNDVKNCWYNSLRKRVDEDGDPSILLPKKKRAKDIKKKSTGGAKRKRKTMEAMVMPYNSSMAGGGSSSSSSSSSSLSSFKTKKLKRTVVKSSIVKKETELTGAIIVNRKRGRTPGTQKKTIRKETTRGGVKKAKMTKKMNTNKKQPTPRINTNKLPIRKRKRKVPEDVQKLIDMGFPHDQCVVALKQGKGDYAQAMVFLFRE